MTKNRDLASIAGFEPSPCCLVVARALSGLSSKGDGVLSARRLGVLSRSVKL